MTAYKKPLEAWKKANAMMSSAAPAKKEGISNDIIKGHKKQAKLFQTEAAKAAAGHAKAAKGIFSLYSNLLSIEQRIYWDNIVEKQIGVTPWTDLKGIKHTKVYAKSEKSFQLCMTRHLLTIFDEDAAKRQRYYVSNQLKKPQWVSICTFFMHEEQLNSYISLMPSIYNSLKATEHTKPAEPFDKLALACMLLTMCPHALQSQYNMNQTTLPQDTRWLLAVLENIKNTSSRLKYGLLHHQAGS
jgi:hypothetical protein